MASRLGGHHTLRRVLPRPRRRRLPGASLSRAAAAAAPLHPRIGSWSAALSDVVRAGASAALAAAIPPPPAAPAARRTCRFRVRVVAGVLVSVHDCGVQWLQPAASWARDLVRAQGILGPMMRALKWTVFEVVAWTAAAGIITALAISAAFYPTGAAAVVTWAASTGAAAAAGWVALLGVSSFSSTYLLNWAWQLEPAGPVDMVNMSFFVAAMLVFQMAVLQAASALVVAPYHRSSVSFSLFGYKPSLGRIPAPRASSPKRDARLSCRARARADSNARGRAGGVKRLGHRRRGCHRRRRLRPHLLAPHFAPPRRVASIRTWPILPHGRPAGRPACGDIRLQGIHDQASPQSRDGGPRS